jgi:hypothetical protein
MYCFKLSYFGLIKRPLITNVFRFQIRIRIRPRASDPYGSGSAILVCRILAGEEVCDIYSMHYSDVHRNGPLQSLTQRETKKRGS